MSRVERSRYLAGLEAENRLLRAKLLRVREVREMATKYTPSPDLVESIVEALDEALASGYGDT